MNNWKVIPVLLVLTIALVVWLRGSWEKPSQDSRTLSTLGVTDLTYDSSVWTSGCGRDLNGGTFKGTLQGNPVTGTYCCSSTRCYYSLD